MNKMAMKYVKNPFLRKKITFSTYFVNCIVTKTTDLKGTDGVILSDPSSKNGYALFTTVPCKHLTNHRG